LKITTVAMLALGLAAAPRMVSAQTMQWTDKGYVSISGAAQVGSHNLDTSLSFPLYDETATVTTSQEVKSGGLFDIGGAYRVWGHNLLAGVHYSHTSSDANVSVNGSIPHPIFFDRPRTVSSSISGAKHSEDVVHLQAIWMIPVANKLDIGIFGGPSIFAVAQDSVSAVSVAESGDLANPTVTPTLTKTKKTVVGGHVGVDVQYLVARKIAVGVLMRYSGASVEIPGANDKLTVGGFQIGGGLRLRF